MTTNDTKAVVAELRGVRESMRENTNLLRLLLKQIAKGEERATGGSTPWDEGTGTSDAQERIGG